MNTQFKKDVEDSSHGLIEGILVLVLVLVLFRCFLLFYVIEVSRPSTQQRSKLMQMLMKLFKIDTKCQWFNLFCLITNTWTITMCFVND
jgi:hypothetical protein